MKKQSTKTNAVSPKTTTAKSVTPIHIPSKAAKWRRNLSGQKKEDLEKKTKPERKRHPNLKRIKEMNRLQTIDQNNKEIRTVMNVCHRHAQILELKEY
jgi:hypothetical protein